MTRNNGERPENLCDEIRRQFGSPVTTRYLRALPPFKFEPGIPDQFADLLVELDRAEGHRGMSGGSAHR